MYLWISISASVERSACEDSAQKKMEERKRRQEEYLLQEELLKSFALLFIPSFSLYFPLMYAEWEENPLQYEIHEIEPFSRITRMFVKKNSNVEFIIMH